jgi:hypothetical protein
MNLEVEVIGSDKFYRAVEMMAATSKRTAIEVINENFKGVIRNLLALSPPMGGKQGDFKLNAKGKKTGGVDFASGKIRGKNTIAVDLGKAFRKVKNPKTSWFINEVDALSWYLKSRNSRKRIKGNYKRQATVLQINFVRKNILDRQGSFAAGWSKAANYFGISLPNWISRWGGSRSRMVVELSEWGYYLTAINITSHREADVIERITARAIEIQTGNMRRQIEAYAEQQAKKVGFTV